MYENSLKSKLKRNQPVLGCIIQGYFPAFSEICGLAGFDFVFIDAEHAPFSERDCEEMVRAAEVRQTVPLIRVPRNEPETILRYMDIGAMGIIVPGVDSAEEAAKAVRAVKYYPEGRRGLTNSRASDYGLRKPLPEYVEQSNRETLVIPLAESRESIANLPEILAAPGVDAVIIGTTDISHSLGVPGQNNHPLVQEAFARALAAGKDSGKPLGAVARGAETPRQYYEQGVNIVLVNLLAILGASLKSLVDSAQSS